jgi:hypothetical protein
MFVQSDVPGTTDVRNENFGNMRKHPKVYVGLFSHAAYRKKYDVGCASLVNSGAGKSPYIKPPPSLADSDTTIRQKAPAKSNIAPAIGGDFPGPPRSTFGPRFHVGFFFFPLPLAFCIGFLGYWLTEKYAQQTGTTVVQRARRRITTLTHVVGTSGVAAFLGLGDG